MPIVLCLVEPFYFKEPCYEEDVVTLWYWDGFGIGGL